MAPPYVKFIKPLGYKKIVSTESEGRPLDHHALWWMPHAVCDLFPSVYGDAASDSSAAVDAP
jgi:hypothetical protein